jgi:hypothetical protein
MLRQGECPGIDSLPGSQYHNPIRHTDPPGYIDSSESIPGLLKRLLHKYGLRYKINASSNPYKTIQDHKTHRFSSSLDIYFYFFLIYPGLTRACCHWKTWIRKEGPGKYCSVLCTGLLCQLENVSLWFGYITVWFYVRMMICTMNNGQCFLGKRTNVTHRGF